MSIPSDGFPRDRHFGEPLTEREKQVMTYLVEGLGNKEIAAILGTSEQTVKNHVTGVLAKLGVQNRTQAAMAWIRKGILDASR